MKIMNELLTKFQVTKQMLFFAKHYNARQVDYYLTEIIIGW